MRQSKVLLEKGFSRLHPVSMIYFIVKGMKEFVGFLPLIPAAILVAPKVLSENVSQIAITVSIISLAILTIISVGWFRWQRFVYRIDENAIYIEHGVWVKHKIWITKERVQSLDTKISIYDRVFGLVRLQIETAGGQKEEAVLSSISLEEAERIRAVLGFAGKSAPQVNDNASHDGEESSDPVETQNQISSEVVRMLSFKELLINSTSSDKFGIVLILSISVLGKLWDSWLKDTNLWVYISKWLGSAWIIWSIGLLIFFSWILAVAVTFLTDYGFQLKLQDGKLVITKGLLEKKQITLLPDRIQAVHLVNHVLRRPFGFVSIRIITAGSKGEQEKSTVVFPLIKTTEVAGFLQQFIPTFSYEEKWSTLEKTAWRNYVLFPALFCTMAAIPLLLWIPGYLRWLALLLPITAFILGLLAFRQVGWSFHEEQLAYRYGLFSQYCVLVPKRRIQWYQMSQTPFQKNRELATIKIALASGKEGKKFTLRHLPESQVHALIHSISFKR